MGSKLGANVGLVKGIMVGKVVVGLAEGSSVGVATGFALGRLVVGSSEGEKLGSKVRDSVGTGEGFSVALVG